MPVYNFSAGPSAIPKEVLRRLEDPLHNLDGSGLSLMEVSHRSDAYAKVHFRAENLLRESLNIPDDYGVLFLQGGASLQFAMVALNLLRPGHAGNYLLTGVWSEKALQEAKRIGDSIVGVSSKDKSYSYIPSVSSITSSPQDSYQHITSNNTIYGTQWKAFPTTTNLVADMSSDILSRPLNVTDFGLIYAGAQKNLGPAGVTVVILRKSLLETANRDIPKILQYRTHVESGSLYNTPPTFAIGVLAELLQWVKEKGGVAEMQTKAKAKSNLLYQVIDESKGFYQGHARKDSRSQMNVTFCLPTKELTAAFLTAANSRGFVGLNGHRVVGGCRASLYNGVSLQNCQALADFMIGFQKEPA